MCDFRPLYNFPSTAYFAIGFSAVALGIARAMLDATIALAMEKKPRLAKTSLLDNHHVQFQIGEAEARLRSARSYVENDDRGSVSGTRSWRPGKLTHRAAHGHPHGGDLRHSRGQSRCRRGLGDRRRQRHLRLGPRSSARLRDLRTLLQQAQGRKSHLQDTGVPPGSRGQPGLRLDGEVVAPLAMLVRLPDYLLSGPT